MHNNKVSKNYTFSINKEGITKSFRSPIDMAIYWELVNANLLNEQQITLVNDIIYEYYLKEDIDFNPIKAAIYAAYALEAIDYKELINNLNDKHFVRSL